MPKTLAALPSSQYATPFEDVSGKNFLLEAFSPELIFWLNEAKGVADAAPVVGNALAAELLNRMFRSIGVFGAHLPNRGASALT
jgi:hypothetical protein